MSDTILKSTAISDAKIQFVSLVDKAANKRQFLIAKGKGMAEFNSYSPILMSDNATHYITGVVYEPMKADSHDNYMTSEEIAKAEAYYRKNSAKVDLQHSFESCPDVTVVDSWIQKCDCTIGEEPVKAGSWLITVKLENDTLWDKVEKKEITGFSMGGVGKYSKEEVELEKSNSSSTIADNKADGLIAKLANLFGYEVVKKGEFTEQYEKSIKDNNFWTAFSTLENVLRHYDSFRGEVVFNENPEEICEALTEFNEVVSNILASNSIEKSIINATNKVDKTKEIEKMDEKTLKEIIKSSVAEVVAEKLSEHSVETEPKESEIQKDDSPLTEEKVREIIKSEVSPIIASEIQKLGQVSGTSQQLDDEGQIEKSEETSTCPLHGLL